MTFWLLLTVNSVTFGGLLFLLSAGFSLIFGLMLIPNLTHGSMFMLGAYFGTTLLSGVLGVRFGFWLAAVIPENPIRGRFAPRGRISASFDAMLAILRLLTTFAANLFRSRRQLEVENPFLRHQLNIALRHAPRRLRLNGSDRAVLVWLTDYGQAGSGWPADGYKGELSPAQWMALRFFAWHEFLTWGAVKGLWPALPSRTCRNRKTGPCIYCR
jgi:hypothetical protein